MKINNFWGELTDISAKKEAPLTAGDTVDLMYVIQDNEKKSGAFKWIKIDDNESKLLRALDQQDTVRSICTYSTFC